MFLKVKKNYLLIIPVTLLIWNIDGCIRKYFLIIISNRVVNPFLFCSITEWQKKRGITTNLATVEPEELANTLRKFYTEGRTKDVQMLSPSGLRGPRAAIHRTYTSPPFSRGISILSDRQFSQRKKIFEAICKQYVQKANPKPKHHPVIGKRDFERLAHI